MELTKVQTLEKLSDDLKRQLKPLLNSAETWYNIEVDIVRDTLRKMYDLLSLQEEVVEEIPKNEPEKEPTIEEVAEKVDRETEELLEKSTQDFGLLFDSKPKTESQVMAKKSKSQQPKLHFEVVEDKPKSTTANLHPPKSNLEPQIAPEGIPLANTPTSHPKLDEGLKLESETKPITPKTPDRTLGENLLSKPIDSLKRNIGINDKFQFINELFHGKMKIYSEKITQIDELSSLDDALKIVAELLEELNWDEESTVYMQFLTYIKRRFA
ncbi:MAG: hypothetical protein JXR34_00245 [Bacteroidales bacterium]|nr:hypothetical protein [Bacteroidales bacterium]